MRDGSTIAVKRGQRGLGRLRWLRGNRVGQRLLLMSTGAGDGVRDVPVMGERVAGVEGRATDDVETGPSVAP